MTFSINILVALAFSSFFSGVEMALLSSNKLRFELDKKKNSLSGWILNHFLERPDYFTPTLQTGYFLAIVSLVIYTTSAIDYILNPFTTSNLLISLLQITAATFLILIAGDFIPRTIFRINPNKTLRFFSLPLYISYILLYPISKLISIFSELILKGFGVKKNHHRKIKKNFGKVDLDYFIRQSLDEASGETEMETEVKIFRNALDFSNIRLRDCIVPRTEVVAIEWNECQETLLEIFIETGLSKIIVFRENLDNIVGYIHSSEMFDEPSDWHTRINQIQVVPETMTANKLMKLLMQQRKSIAAVVDEFGGISGIVTMEDLVEEIFGEIEDEHDTKSYISKKISETEYVFSGRLDIDKINEQYELNLPESESYTTLAGLILHYHQKFPKLNETVVIEPFSFKILKVSSTRIDLLRLKVH